MSLDDRTSLRGRFRRWMHRTGTEILGWLLVVVGIAALVLPGPGLLMLLGGLVVLSNHYDWAERRVEPVKVRAFDAARAGVKTWPRIVASACGALFLVGAGVVWWISPTIPQWWLFGPEVPFAGWPTGSSLILSGLIAFGLLVYSVRRWRYGHEPEPYDDAESSR